jgi:hypothetical protein
MGLNEGHDRISRDVLRFLVLTIYPFSAIFGRFYETQGQPCVADLVIYSTYNLFFPGQEEDYEDRGNAHP